MFEKTEALPQTSSTAADLTEQSVQVLKIVENEKEPATESEATDANSSKSAKKASKTEQPTIGSFFVSIAFLKLSE